MEEWILGLIAAALGPVRGLVDAVTRRLQSLYAAFTDALSRVRTRFGQWVQAGRSWAAAELRHVTAVYVALAWLKITHIPASIRHAVDALESWAIGRIATVAALLRAEATQLRAWLVDLVSDALRLLSQVKAWAVAEVTAIKAVLSRILDHVFGPLATPDRLAKWIFAALVGLAVDYLLDHGAALAEIAWRHRRQLEGKAMDLLPDALDRIG